MDSVGNGKGSAIISRGVCGSQALLAVCFPALDISLILNMLVEKMSAAKDRKARLLHIGQTSDSDPSGENRKSASEDKTTAA